jgi:hypothetical protein
MFGRLANRMVIVNTAKWAGDYYYDIVEIRPNWDVNNVMKGMIDMRYNSPGYENPELFKRMFEEVDSGLMGGISHLVINFLIF